MVNRASRLTFFRVVQISLALSVGALSGFVWSIQEITPNFRLALTPGAAVAFAFGAIAGWFFWKSVWESKGDLRDTRAKRKLALWGIGFTAFLVGSFAYGLRGHSSDKLMEIVVGTVTALIFLSIAAALLFSVMRHFNSEERK